MNYLLCSTNVSKHSTLGLHEVAHGIIKPEATYRPPLSSKFYDMIFAQFISSYDSFVMMLFTYSLYDPLYCCPPSFLRFLLSTGLQQTRSQRNKPQHVARAHTLFKMQTKNSCVFPQVYPNLQVKNNTSSCGKFHGYLHHQNGLGHMLKPPITNESCGT